MEIYLVRHTSVDVPKGIVYGWTDVDVKNTFEEEAARVKAVLDRLSFDRVMTSPLQRCTKLATYCGYPDAERNDLLKELNFGEWEMQSWDEIYRDPRSKGWFDNWKSRKTPAGESLEEQLHRLALLIEDLSVGGQGRICLFTHGGIIQCARFLVKEITFDNFFADVPPYGGIYKLDLPDRYIPRAHNDLLPFV